MDSTKTKRISRLTAILTQLQAKRLVTATELASRYAVRIRTIYWDIRTLEEAGIPIVTEEGKGYSMMEGYKLPPVMFTDEGGKAAVDIAELWQKFMSENVADKLPNKVDDTVYSLYTDYEGDHTGAYTAMLCCKVDDLNAIPEGMIGRSFGGGNYVQFTAKGDLANGLIVKEWQKIWGMDLDRAFTTDFEVFGEKVQNPSDAEVDFLIAVK